MTDYYARTIAPTVRETRMAEVPLQVKRLEPDGVFAGYASVFDVVDSQADVIRPGAFHDSLQGRLEDIKLLWQHDMREPIGVIEELREDVRGLYIKGRLMLEVARAREAYSLLQSGVVKGLSIGYSPRRFRVDPVSGIRTLSAVDLWEVSLVTFPANEAAQVTVVKGLSGKAALMAALDRAIRVTQHYS